MCDIKKIEGDLRIISDNILKMMQDIEYQRGEVEGLKNNDERIKSKIEDLNVDLNVKVSKMESKITVGFQISKVLFFAVFYLLIMV